MSTNPNPQGKGGSPVLAALDETRAAGLTVPPKHIEQVSTELFTALFVLASDFRFKPVPGKRYYLYRKTGHFWLGLTPPQMLNETVAGRFIGNAMLQSDMTWTLELADAVAADPAFMDYLEDRRTAFEQRLQDAETIDEILPVHEKSFDFYRRASAFAVAHSLQRSMTQSGISGLSYDEAKGLIAHESTDEQQDR